MVRATSKAAYLDQIWHGRVNARALQILKFVAKHKNGVTRNFIEREMGIRINIVSGRVSDLIRDNYLIEDGCRRDPITKQSLNVIKIHPSKLAGYESIRIPAAA